VYVSLSTLAALLADKCVQVWLAQLHALLLLLLQDEAAVSQPRPVGTSSASSAAALRAAAASAKQLTKCKFKACQLTFSTELNKHRCHMSHLPSARNTTTKVGPAVVAATALHHTHRFGWAA
jgi:hypothetical protein